MRNFAILLIFGIDVLLAGCGSLSGASSMRIDVEVYKGPLSKEPEIQWAELHGMVIDAENYLDVFLEMACSIVTMDDKIQVAQVNGKPECFPNRIRTTDFIYGTHNYNNRIKHLEELGNALQTAEFEGERLKAVSERLLSRASELKSNQTGLTEKSDAAPRTPLSGDVFEVTDANSIVPQEIRGARLDRDQLRAWLAQVKQDWSSKSQLTQQPDLPEERVLWKWCSPKLTGSTFIDDLHACLIYAQAFEEAINLKAAVTKLRLEYKSSHNYMKPLTRFRIEHMQDSEKETYAGFIHKTAVLAMRMKTSAELWGYNTAIGNPRRIHARIVSTTLANLTSEISNQLGSRGDSLLKQIEGDDRALLPPSVYLRDSQTTDFVNLVAWKRVGNLPLWSDLILNPIRGFSSRETVDRVRMVERLYADNYWSNVNNVYASGRGDVSMAFIKDDIGNWNLKSFDNDPSSLLDAYKKAGLGILKATVDLAKSAAGSPDSIGKAQQLIGLSDRLTMGKVNRGGGSSGSINVAVLRQRTIDKIKVLGKQVEAKATALDKAKKASIDSEAKIGDLATETPKCKTESVDLETMRIEVNDETRVAETRISALRSKNPSADVTSILDVAAKNVEEAKTDLSGATEENKCAAYALSGRRVNAARARMEQAEKTYDVETILPGEVKTNLTKILDDHEATLDSLAEATTQAKPEAAIR